jgi:predicted phage tail protein
MRVIKVYGPLAKFLGRRQFKAVVNTPAEAIRFLVANFPKLKAHMADQYYKVCADKTELDVGSHLEQLHYPMAQTECIRIIPVIAGAGGAAAKIGIGIALVAAAFIIGPAVGGFLGIGAGLGGATGAGAAGSLGLVGAGFASAIGTIGISLVLGGVAQLISPTPKISSGEDSTNDPRKSYSFSGIQNVARQGVPVPVVYGEMIVGSVTISAGINTEDD